MGALNNAGIRKPRLFYWEDSEDCYCVANDKDFPGLVAQLISRGVCAETLRFYFVNDESKLGSIHYDVGSSTLSMLIDSIENYIALDFLDEDDEITLTVKLQFMSDSEFNSLPEI